MNIDDWRESTEARTRSEQVSGQQPSLDDLALLVRQAKDDEVATEAELPTLNRLAARAAADAELAHRSRRHAELRLAVGIEIATGAA